MQVSPEQEGRSPGSIVHLLRWGRGSRGPRTSTVSSPPPAERNTEGSQVKIAPLCFGEKPEPISWSILPGEGHGLLISRRNQGRRHRRDSPAVRSANTEHSDAFPHQMMNGRWGEDSPSAGQESWTGVHAYRNNLEGGKIFSWFSQTDIPGQVIMETQDNR